MKWDYTAERYLRQYCTVRGLRHTTVKAYGEVLAHYIWYMRERKNLQGPEKVRTDDVISYIKYLREERGNGSCTVHKAVGVLKSYYRGLVCLKIMDREQNPMIGFPRIKRPSKKLREVLTEKEMENLITAPREDTVMGIRDRSLLVLLLETGIRASECANLREKDVRLDENLIQVTGKGGDERVLPLEGTTAHALRIYRKVKGKASPESRFFRSRKGGGLSRHGIYSRVRIYARKAGIKKKVTPHILRHTFATHMLKTKKMNLVQLKETLGHRLLVSTQVYVHMTVMELREAIEHHPLRRIGAKLIKYLPDMKIPFQYPPGTRFGFESP